MKKLKVSIFALVLVLSLAGVATATSYWFHDTIDNWSGDGIRGRVLIPNDPGTFEYQDVITDEVDFAAGDLATVAYPALDFDWDWHVCSGTIWQSRMCSSTLFGCDQTGSHAPVPEPCTMILLGVGLVGMAVPGRKKIFKKK